MRSKHLISLTALWLSTAACSSDSPNDGPSGVTTATGGQLGSGGSKTASGGVASVTGGANTSGGSISSGGKSSTGGSAASPAGGSGGSTGGSSTSGGSPMTGGTAPAGGSAGTTTGGTNAGGASGGSGGATGGMPSSGGSGPAASFKCANLSLAPSMTGVAKPAGAVGGLKVLDWAGFKGAASFTFDDNTPSQMPNYEALKATGGHVTWFVVGSWLNGSADVAKFKATIADGQEVANHTYNHQSAGSKSDLEQTQTFIMQNFGVAAHSMAAPNCASAWASVAPDVLFQNRGPCGKGIATISPRDDTNRYELPAYLPDSNESAASMGNAIQAGKWRIFVLHGFDSQGGTYQPVPIANVTGAMSKAVMDGYWVEGMTAVGAYWQGQKLIPESATTSATWTLPPRFPPNMCLRITTSGGTVTQKGETIPWDDHGYYQISLDAGEVTIQ